MRPAGTVARAGGTEDRPCPPKGHGRRAGLPGGEAAMNDPHPVQPSAASAGLSILSHAREAGVEKSCTTCTGRTASERQRRLRAALQPPAGWTFAPRAPRADRIDLSRRRDKLSWSHHAEVAGLPADAPEQVELFAPEGSA